MELFLTPKFFSSNPSLKLFFPGLLSRDPDSDDETEDLTNSGAADLDTQDNTITQHTSETQISRTESLDILDGKIVNMGDERETKGNNSQVKLVNLKSEEEKVKPSNSISISRVGG